MSAASESDQRALDAIDSLLLETMADSGVLAWALDRPLLPREARAALQRHKAKPSSMAVGTSRESVHAAERQLRAQHASFVACAAALRAGDASMVPAGNPAGSGHDETRELLVDAAELRALLPEGSAEAADLHAQHVALAVAFEVAAQSCMSCALHLQAERHALHGRDYQRVLLSALGDEEAEAVQRQKNAGKPAEGARA